MIEGSEETCEEKDLRYDEKDYSVSQAFLDGGSVMALECSFSDYISSSLEYG